MRRTKKRRLRARRRAASAGPLLAVAGAWILWSGAAGAQVVNGSFDADLAGWSEPGSDLQTVWDTRDAAGSTSSGSMRVRNVGVNDNGGIPIVSQCVPVSGGSTIEMKASALVAPGQPAPIEAEVILNFNDGLDCVGNFLFPPESFGFTEESGAWQEKSISVVVPSAAQTVRVGLGLRKPGGGPAVTEVLYDEVRLLTADGDCVAAFDELCLNADSFKVDVSWRDAAGNSGAGQALPLTADSGLFWFFDADNPELLVKVVDGCALNDRFWVFAAGTTDVGFDLDVTHEETGVSRRYSNPIGTASDAVTDTDAFAVCP